jgi:hypothetical protein
VQMCNCGSRGCSWLLSGRLAGGWWNSKPVCSWGWPAQNL